MEPLVKTVPLPVQNTLGGTSRLGRMKQTTHWEFWSFPLSGIHKSAKFLFGRGKKKTIVMVALPVWNK